MREAAREAQAPTTLRQQFWKEQVAAATRDYEATPNTFPPLPRVAPSPNPNHTPWPRPSPSVCWETAKEKRATWEHARGNLEAQLEAPAKLQPPLLVNPLMGRSYKC